MIDYKKELNPAQYEAAMTLEGPLLCIAGAGSGKTRTVVYRLANMVEQGVAAHDILLLTFTRKASQEMLHRAGELLGHGIGAVSGGTFHGFAYSVLRQHPPQGFEGGLSIMDSADATEALKYCKDTMGLGKGDKSFPKTATVMGMLSKARNKEREIGDILQREAFHLAAYRDDIVQISTGYSNYKREHGLLDYDDLLFELENLLRTRPDLLDYYRHRFKYIMVDEYQDTNLVQARLVQLLAGGHRNVMAVGDDAQSIYAFRGANVQNILEFPAMFPGTRIVKLEENYRSVQPVLDLTNAILAEAPVAFHKTLFTSRTGGNLPQLVKPLSDLTQANQVVNKIAELRRSYEPKDIAVLFRAGYQSYHVEMQLSKAGIPFRKYGGVKYSDAAHVKDVMCYVRLLINPLDLPAFQRLAANVKGVGPKTALKIYEASRLADPSTLDRLLKKYPDFATDLELVDSLRRQRLEPVEVLEEVLEVYKPRLMQLYPDDYPRREHGLEQLVQIAATYRELDLFVSDLSLEDPNPDAAASEDHITLSTVHSAKGLEWDAVLVIDLVEERFPSKQALQKADDLEEERRLMYVACTRAREYLGLFVPSSIYSRGGGGNEPAMPSPFVRDLPVYLYEEWKENYTGGLMQREYQQQRTMRLGDSVPAAPDAFSRATGGESEPAFAPRTASRKLGHCTHKIFGRGKLIKHLPPDKYQVNFPGFGLKVIMEAYLQMEE
jgi:DNA helicase-2/ATP-dependent DNA helicase PcrA